MRERHLPRVCRSCQAAMARQENACWRCGTQWASEDGPRTTLKVIPGRCARTGRGPATADDRRHRGRGVRRGGSLDNEGGSVDTETAAQIGAVR